MRNGYINKCKYTTIVYNHSMDDTQVLISNTAMMNLNDDNISSADATKHQQQHSTSSSQVSLPTPTTLPPPQPAPNITAECEYELGPVIGFGSTAIVHSGRHCSSGQPVAIKVFDLDRFEQSQIDRLRQELSIQSALGKHENILSHLQVLTRGNELWVVMPLCGAGSVSDVMRWSGSGGGLEEAVIASILAQTVSGLCHLHSTGHCHRDIKAANLLLDQDGTVRLADFGVSASVQTQSSNDSRKTFVGTPCWMAPEVMEGGGYDGRRADIWSLGILGLELAYGQAPYAKYPPMKVIYLTLSAAHSPTLEKDRCRQKYSKTMKDFIDLCLQRDPMGRPTAEQLLKHPLIRSAKKPSFLVERLVMRTPPITARNPSIGNIGIGASCNTATANNDSCPVEWDFSDTEITNNNNTKGTVSRKGRFTVTDAGLDAALSDTATNTTIRKGRFSIECATQVDPTTMTPSVDPNTVTISTGQLEQLALLVDMLKEHIEQITASGVVSGQARLGMHRRSNTTIGARRDSTDLVDRRDSLK